MSGYDLRHRGFTLLEVLVVLMITSLVSAILFQGLGSVLKVRSTVASTVLNLRDVVLQRNIILDPLRGIIPDHPRGAHIFKGDSRSLTGLTIRPLGESTGAPRPFALSFTYDPVNNITQLIYQAEDDAGTQLIASWEGNHGRFSYSDIGGNWLEFWPPPNAGPRPVQTPWLIGVETGSSENELLLAYISSPHERRPRLQDIGFGSGNEP